MEGPWTILELAELAAEALTAAQPGASSDGARAGFGVRAGASASGSDAGAEDGAGTGSGAGAEDEAAGFEPVGPRPVRANGRVRDVPNERLVRWYVTVGLVDPPLSRRGRVAQYGRRHLLQLVAVKRRQAEGRSLAEIQAELAGATDETLAAVARVPTDGFASHASGPTPARFWARSAGQRDSGAGEAAGEPGEGRTGWSGGGVVHGIRLGPGVVLLLEDGGREPGPDEVTEIVNAARPLLAELASRRLTSGGSPEGS